MTGLVNAYRKVRVRKLGGVWGFNCTVCDNPKQYTAIGSLERAHSRAMAHVRWHRAWAAWADTQAHDAVGHSRV